MNYVKAESNRTEGHKYPVQPRQNPQSSATVRADDAVRDFFRRGDRGQYEGGAADLGIIPTWDLPERPRMVRTERQQARRVILKQVVATVVVACLVLLITAARLKSHDAIEKPAVIALQNSSVHAEPLVPSPVPAQPRLLKPPPPPIAESTAIQSAPTAVSAARAQPQAGSSSAATKFGANNRIAHVQGFFYRAGTPPSTKSVSKLGSTRD